MLAKTNNLVALEFQRDDNVVKENRESSPGSADAGVLSETYFVLPVSLIIGGVELLETPARSSGEQPPSWLPIPILDMATAGLDAVKEAKKKGNSMYSLSGFGSRLYFNMSGNEVVVYSQVNGREARTSYGQLLNAFERFALEVRCFLIKNVPELREHPYWGRWLSGK